MTEVNVLISSGGRRLELLSCIRESLADAGLGGAVCVVDCSTMAPAMFAADRSWQVPRCSSASFLPTVLELVRQQRIDLIVPTQDLELPLYAEAREKFAREGVCVAISSPLTVAISEDKRLTHRWLVDHGFPTVRQALVKEALANRSEWDLPLLVKPARGSASAGVRILRAAEELELLADTGEELIVQEIAEGDEYTINVYVDRRGRCLCAVPHQRLEVRGGEVSKAVTRRYRPLMELARAIAETLPGAYGVLNIQCFLAPSGDIRVIEINARVGGGYPLAHHAGAPFTRWLLDEVRGELPAASFDGWVDDLAMLRFDSSIFQPGHRIRSANHDAVLSSAGSG